MTIEDTSKTTSLETVEAEEILFSRMNEFNPAKFREERHAAGLELLRTFEALAKGAGYGTRFAPQGDLYRFILFAGQKPAFAAFFEEGDTFRCGPGNGDPASRVPMGDLAVVYNARTKSFVSAARDAAGNRRSGLAVLADALTGLAMRGQETLERKDLFVPVNDPIVASA